MSDSSKERHIISVLPRDHQNTEYNIISLPHCSKHNEATLCLRHNGEYLELQGATISKYGSFLIHNRVSSSNQIFLASKFDPRFSLLPLFYMAREKYSPLPQILITMSEENAMFSSGAPSLFDDIMKDPKRFKLDDLCDINDKHGDMIFYRYSSEKVLSWLRNKVERVAKVISHKRSKKEQPNSLTAASFVISNEGDENGSVLSVQNINVTTNDIKIAIEIVCDCLDDVHTDLLVKSYEFPSSEVLPKYQTGKRLADWQIELEKEKESVAMSNLNSAKQAKSIETMHSVPPPNKIQKTISKSEQANKFAAKGTQSLKSFFKVDPKKN